MYRNRKKTWFPLGSRGWRPTLQLRRVRPDEPTSATMPGRTSPAATGSAAAPKDVISRLVALSGSQGAEQCSKYPPPRGPSGL